MYFSSTLAPIVIGMFIAGFGVSLVMPTLMMLIGNAMPPSESPKGFAVMNVFSGVAGFISTIFAAFLMSMFNTTDPKFSVAVAVICFGAFAVVYTIIKIFKKITKQKKLQNIE